MGGEPLPTFLLYRCLGTCLEENTTLLTFSVDTKFLSESRVWPVYGTLLCSKQGRYSSLFVVCRLFLASRPQFLFHEFDSWEGWRLRVYALGLGPSFGFPAERCFSLSFSLSIPFLPVFYFLSRLWSLAWDVESLELDTLYFLLGGVILKWVPDRLITVSSKHLWIVSAAINPMARLTNLYYGFRRARYRRCFFAKLLHFISSSFRILWVHIGM